MKLRAFVSAPIGKSRNPAVFEKNAILRVEYVTGGKYTQKPEFQCFPGDVDFEVLRKLTPGEEVDIEFTLTTRSLTNKAKEEVKVDGYTKWVLVATARSVKPVAAGAPLDDEKLPW